PQLEVHWLVLQRAQVVRERQAADGQSGEPHPEVASGDRNRRREAAGEDPVELPVLDGRVRANPGAILRAPGWRNWRDAPDLKSGVPLWGRAGSIPAPGITSRNPPASRA